MLVMVVHDGNSGVCIDGGGDRVRRWVVVN